MLEGWRRGRGRHNGVHYTHTHTHTGREGVSVLLGAPSVLWEGNRQCAVRQNWELGDLSSNSDSAIGVM